MSFTINDGKELAQAPRSVILADFTFSDGAVWRASTLGGTYGGHAYEAALSDENLDRLQYLSEQGIDRIPSAKLIIADTQKTIYADWDQAAGRGFRGATVLLRMALLDVSAGEWSTDSIVPFIGTCDQADVDDRGLTVNAQNKLNLAPYQLPSVLITARCPWINPSTTEQRTEASDPNSRFFRCGETRDLVTAPPCSYTKQTCTQPTHYGGSTWQTQKTGTGREYINGNKIAWTNPDTSGKYKQYWPQWLGGAAWVQVPVLNQWADGNYTRGEAAVGVGPVEILRVVANGVELDKEGTGGSADYRWHPVNDGSRSGTANTDTGYTDGDVYGNESVIQFLAPHGTIDPNTTATVRVLARTIQSTASLAVVSASASGGLIRIDFSGSAPADGPGDGRTITITGNSWAEANGTFIIRYLDSPVTSHAFLEGTSATGSGSGGTLYYESDLVGSGGAVPTPWVIQEALRATGRFSDPNFGTTWGPVAAICSATIPFTDQDGNETSQMRFSSAVAIAERRSAGEVVRGLRQSIGALLYIGEDGKLEISIDGPLAEQQPAPVDGSNYDTAIESTLRDGTPTDGFAAYRFDESNSRNLRRVAQANSTTPNKVVFPFVDAANDYAVSTFAEVDPEDVSRLDQETGGGLQVQPEGVASYNHAYRIGRLGLAKILRGNAAGDTRGTDWWQWESSIRACRLRLGQLVLLNDATLGLEEQLVRITGVQWSRNYETVTITAHHHEDSWHLDTPSTLADPGRSFYQFTPPGPIVANPLRLTFPNTPGQVGVAYSAALRADYGVLPYTLYVVVSGSLPAGLSLDASTGIISGTPTTAGLYAFTARVTDSTGTPATADFDCSINVSLPSGASVLLAIATAVGRDVGHTTDIPDPATRLVTFQVGALATFASTPHQYDTLLLSRDGGSNWLGIGWYLSTSSGQEFFISQPRPASSETWKIAFVPGTIQYDAANTIPTASLPAGAVLSSGFTVAALDVPSATLGTNPTVGSGGGGSFPYNKITQDGYQYWSIPSIDIDLSSAYADPNAFVINVTFQDLDSSHASVGPEHIYGNVVAVDGSVNIGRLDGDYGTNGYSYTRTGNIAYVRAKFYASNRVDQTTSAFSNPAASTLQTDVGTGAGYIDILVASGGATPTGALVGPRVVGSVPAADTTPWTGVTGTIDVGGGGAAHAIQEIKNAAGTVIAWFGKKTVSAVDYYGIWGANVWIGGTDPTNPKAWIDGSGNLHMVGTLEGGGVDLITGLYEVVFDNTTGGFRIYLAADHSKYMLVTSSSIVITDGVGLTSFDINGFSVQGKLEADQNGKLTKVADITTVGYGVAPVVFKRKDVNQTGSFSFQITDEGSAPTGLYRVNLAATANVSSVSGTGEVFVAFAFTWNEGVGINWDATGSVLINGHATGGSGVGASKLTSFVVRTDGSTSNGTVGMQIICTVTEAWTNSSSFDVWVMVERLDR